MGEPCKLGRNILVIVDANGDEDDIVICIGNSRYTELPAHKLLEIGREIDASLSSCTLYFKPLSLTTTRDMIKSLWENKGGDYHTSFAWKWIDTSASAERIADEIMEFYNDTPYAEDEMDEYSGIYLYPEEGEEEKSSDVSDDGVFDTGINRSQPTPSVPDDGMVWINEKYRK